ncbi:hypothetical protein [Streptomyces sp. DH12]|uniref:hypothetical protein n=1 Tax=Streptomyces sp. DH12 TaxID=2857010 RepID=UPI001E4F1ED8|nr:hypothetical protein [Streptomyces sp. DH12]
MNGTTLSLAGLAAAVIIAWANFRPWWQGTRDPKALLPYGSGWLLGALATICVGGALGWGAAGIAGLTAGASDTVVGKLVGTAAAQLATARMGTLTPAGGVVVALVLGGVILLYKASDKKDKRRVLGGVICGTVMAALPGIAAALGWLPDTVNAVGAYGHALAGGGTL